MAAVLAGAAAAIFASSPFSRHGLLPHILFTIGLGLLVAAMVVLWLCVRKRP